MLNELQLLMLSNALKGSETKIITAFLFTGRPLDKSELIKWTGLERHTVETGLKQLSDYGIVVQYKVQRRTVFMLSINALPGFRKLEELERVGDSLQLEGIPPKEGFIIISDSTYLNASLNLNNNNNKSQLEGFPPTGNSETGCPPRTPGESDALSQAFAEFKIVGKKRDELIGLAWVSAEYVRAHVEYAKAEGRGEFAVGMAITRMIGNTPQPGFRKNGHIENCNCAKCQIDDTLGKYTRGLPDYDDDESEGE